MNIDQRTNKVSWWEGDLYGKRGLFPASNVIKVNCDVKCCNYTSFDFC